jgi:hypothetical protein
MSEPPPQQRTTNPSQEFVKPTPDPLTTSSSSDSSIIDSRRPQHGRASSDDVARGTALDLEKAATRNSLERTTSSRVNRVNTLTRRRRQEEFFTHPLSHVITSPDNLVDFDGDDDPYKPMNWPFRKKCITTLLYGLTTMGATFASSVYSPAVKPLSEEYEVGTQVTILGISFLLAGFGLGPLVWGPVSEIYGRKPTVLFPYFIGAMFSFGTGAAKDIQTILITRFFTGLFASAPVTNTGGVLSDIWPATQRGTAIVGYVSGPSMSTNPSVLISV